MPSGPGDPSKAELPMLEVLGIDLQSAWRALGSAPGFTAAAIIVLGNGIASATVMFALVQGVLLRCARCLVAACDARDGVKDGVAPARSSVSINGAETINRSRALGSPLRDRSLSIGSEGLRSCDECGTRNQRNQSSERDCSRLIDDDDETSFAWCCLMARCIG